MIIQLESDIQPQVKEDVIQTAQRIGYKPMLVSTQFATYVVCIGKKDFDIRAIGSLPGVRDVHYVSDDYQLVSRKWKTKRSTIELGDGVKIGDGAFQIMAGPCSIENEGQVESVAQHLQRLGVRIMRGGVFKPRSSPYSFRGLGLEGLKMFSAVCRERGIKIITEVMEVAQIEPMYQYVDIYQVGARNSQNFNLLEGLGAVDKPVMIKRGISGTIEELLYSAEYVFSAGNERLLLCERGIRTYENASRNTFDINAVPLLRDKTHLPVIVDPSHAIGIREFVEPVALAGAAAGADGVIVEIHETPEEAASDAAQTLNYEESERLFKKIRAIVELRAEWSAA
jgi:3-deoxy-7-phosphoheptulonate synthase